MTPVCSLRTMIMFSAFVALWLVVVCNGQITFSRDWNAGKRSSPELADQCTLPLKSLTNICHMFLNEVRHLAACESRTAFRIMQNEDTDGNQGVMFPGGR